MSLISRNLLVLTNMSMSLSPNLKCHITTFSDLNAIIEYSASHLRCEEDTFCLQAYEINRLFLKTQANEHAISEIHKKLVTLIFVQNQIELNIEILKCNLAQIDQSLVILERCECGEKSSKSVITDTYRTNMYNLLQTVAFSLDNLAQLTDEIDCYKATSSNTYNDIERVGQVMQCHLKSLETIEMKIEKLKSASDDEQKMAIIRKAFQMFDTAKTGYIETVKIATILNTMGQLFDEGELNNLIRQKDPDRSGKVNFDGFADIAIHFLEEDDDESTQQELKEAFRLYDREGNGYITTGTLKEILRALDDKLTGRELDGIIAEIDTDGSGTVDFDEFMEMMTGD